MLLLGKWILSTGQERPLSTLTKYLCPVRKQQSGRGLNAGLGLGPPLGKSQGMELGIGMGLELGHGMGLGNGMGLGMGHGM